MTAEPAPTIHVPSNLPEPPVELQQSGRRVWDAVVAQFELDPPDLQTLAVACEAYDIAARHKRKLDREGLTYKDKAGNPRPHPSCSEYRNSLDTYRKMVRELALGVDVPDTRPATLPRGYR